VSESSIVAVSLGIKLQLKAVIISFLHGQIYQVFNKMKYKFGETFLNSGDPDAMGSFCRVCIRCDADIGVIYSNRLIRLYYHLKLPTERLQKVFVVDI
jgi:hypothetical protein